jgi:hypothetical protein
MASGSLLIVHTPSFLGLSRDKDWFWSDTSYGCGVVIGILDRGIDGKHKHLQRDTSTEETQCNRNLVGSKSFVHSRL